MNDRMYGLPFHRLVEIALQTGFGVDQPTKLERTPQNYFGHPLELGLGIAAGPQTQLAQNLIAGYLAGARFFELKTVQTLDGEDLPVAKPCIDARDEGYNVEWSTELRVEDALDEYIKAWVAIHLLAKELGLGDANAVVFNMSVGYTYEGITSPKIDCFLDGLKDAASSVCFQDCIAQAKAMVPKLRHVTEADIDAIPGDICHSIALSTLHGAKPEEIEKIAEHLLREKKLSTFVKCNPTLLGETRVRELLNSLGFQHLVYDPAHFDHDLTLEEAVVMFERLLRVAEENGVHFGVKLTNTFPVKNQDGVLAGDEKYLSGKALYPLSLSVAILLNGRFDGRLPMSYSGGADGLSLKELAETGIWPITVCTTLLKSGGYYRLKQLADVFPEAVYELSTKKMNDLLMELTQNPAYHSRVAVPKSPDKVPLHQCGIAPCQDRCPINQDVDGYLEMMKQERYREAFEIILKDNALPAITGDCCYATCEQSCRRNHYDEPLRIRSAKAYITDLVHNEHLARITRPTPNDQTVAIVGAGAAGLSAGYYFAREGFSVDIYDAAERSGGILDQVIGSLKANRRPIDMDVERLEQMGVRIHLRSPIHSLEELQADIVVLATGSHITRKLLGDQPMLSGPYVIGDMTRERYSSVVQCMADAKALVERIKESTTIIARDRVIAKKGILQLKGELPQEGERCLHCRSHCESCVDVCPNRANLSVDIGLARREIVHVDALCNYCGNCEAFCPYDSKPYLEKFTVFRSMKDFEESVQPGYYVGNPEVVRGEQSDITQRLIDVLRRDYAWLGEFE